MGEEQKWAKKTDLGRSEFLWLNGNSDLLVQSPRSKVVSSGARALAAIAADGWTTTG
jgi:IS4 transposase